MESESWRASPVHSGEVSYDELQNYIAACNMMLLPLKDTNANRERWPSKIGDYLATGRLVAACAVGDLRRVVFNFAERLPQEAYPKPLEELLQSQVGRRVELVKIDTTGA